MQLSHIHTLHNTLTDMRQTLGPAPPRPTAARPLMHLLSFGLRARSTGGGPSHPPPALAPEVVDILLFRTRWVTYPQRGHCEISDGLSLT